MTFQLYFWTDMIQGNFYGCNRCLVQCVYIVVSGIDRSTLGFV